MPSLIPRAKPELAPPLRAPALSAKQAYDLARLHLERGAEEDYLVWTMIAEFLEAVEKQAQPSLN